MNDESVPPVAPPPGVKTPGKPRYMLIGIGAVVLLGLFKIFSGPSSSAASAGGPVGGTEAPAARPAGGNPILGTWTLLDTNTAAHCDTERVFETYEDATAKHHQVAIYVVQPTYVEVGYGGQNIEEWELHGPDDVTLRMTSPNSVGYSSPGSDSSTVQAQAQANCRYHRK